MLLRGATLATLDPPRVERADLRIEGDRVALRAASLPARDGEPVMELDGALVLPGLVNAHTHLYSALARGMPPPKAPPRSFVEILERVWWRLDRALDEEAIRLSGLVGAIEAALSGVTLLVDHHSSPSHVCGSLALLKDAIEEVGLRSVLCYEVTDRNGSEGRDRGIEENVSFQARGQSALTRGMIGAHASFTLGDESLEGLAAAARQTGSGLHIHAAEDRADVEDCRARYGCSIPERLERHGVLSARTLLAHCVHLSPSEVETAHAHGAWIAHNARSNMNNSVGHAPTSALRRAALGTDGIDQDVLAEARGAYLKMRDAGRADAAGGTLQLVAGGHRLAAALFGLPFGTLAEGAPADLIVLEYRPPTPLDAGNLAGHLLFGVDRSHVASVMVAGRWVVRERRLANVDVEAVFARARSAAGGLWRRMGGEGVGMGDR
jgi:putative selenium metabolism protein SsnA